ncbi:MAG: tRNA (adenosine(37)-N6)-dimethylallyltransferase MiaA [Acidimicrobiia bacterium]|nr:tRNA (adenosine(37)-N6)-dimethylallyltransferase MiaA [Acidimicrobiia bacterium]
MPSAGPSPAAALVGPTASGKSALAVRWARRAGDVEILSVDSMGLYRGMEVGTAVPPLSERHGVRHHLVGVVEPHEEFTVARFQQLAIRALAEATGRGHRVLAVGGSALYLRAVVDHLTIPGRYPEVRADLERDPDTAGLHRRLAELDPVAAGRMEPTNRRRVVRALEVTVGSGRPFSSFGDGLDAYPPTTVRMVGLRWDRRALDQRIADRLDAQLAAGFLAEVERLAASPVALSHTAAQALGYRELLAHLRGELSLDEARRQIVRRTRRFARRQERWLRRDPRIVWVDVTGEPADAFDEVASLLDGAGTSGS